MMSAPRCPACAVERAANNPVLIPAAIRGAATVFAPPFPTAVLPASGLQWIGGPWADASRTLWWSLATCNVDGVRSVKVLSAPLIVPMSFGEIEGDDEASASAFYELMTARWSILVVLAPIIPVHPLFTEKSAMLIQGRCEAGAATWIWCHAMNAKAWMQMLPNYLANPDDVPRDTQSFCRRGLM
jgi:hypothetical protein